MTTIQDSFWQGMDLTYLSQLYDQYLGNPESLDPTLKNLFDELKEVSPKDLKSFHWGHQPFLGNTTGAFSAETLNAFASKSLQALLLIRAYRVRGHLLADLDPLRLTKDSPHQDLDPKTYGFDDTNMSEQVHLGSTFVTPNASIHEILATLKRIYCGHIGVEFMHIQDPEKRAWIQDHLESEQHLKPFEKDEKIKIYEQLIAAEEFEHFLQVKFTGTKRFGLEGGESLIPGLESLLELASTLGVRDVTLGMSHRGRLNVLTNIMNKPHETLFSQFQGVVPNRDDIFGSGDVKYHLGTSCDRTLSGNRVHLSLNPNPSHLEAVDPVVVGKVRAKKRRFGNESRIKAMGILMHGDAAFAGQGIVSETFLLSALEGYSTGGTIHFVINNQIGFTTSPHESRSSPYCSDIGKMVQAPIFHVNGDNPEAVRRIAELAMEYRQTFFSDVIIDMFCYRKQGHNETDEPAFTQPLMYQQIKNHLSVKTLYGQRLLAEKVLSEEELQQKNKTFLDKLENAYNAAKTHKASKNDWLEGVWADIEPGQDLIFSPETGVSLDVLKRIGEKTTEVPSSFTLNPKIVRLFKARIEALEKKGPIDWGTAELLAYGSLLEEGVHVRLSGQDCERGTFSHRHAVLTDQTTNAKYTPLNHIYESQGYFEVMNSPLSEVAVLGFEYGYSLAEPHALILWEAQFGDFANGAQVVIDQFISSGENKWLRMSGLVLLLPHAYEGQGPEHSSARLERYLQLCAENNMQVANCTTPANFFHILRRQLKRNYRKPLVIMSPKSLLRLDLCTSSLEDIGPNTHFMPVLEDPDLQPSKTIKRVVLCSGKIFYDLLKARREGKIQDVALIRVEQLYPFPEKEIAQALEPFSDADFVWCQEEPQNMGAWTFIDRRLENVLVSMKTKKTRPIYAGRPESASTATGYEKWHQIEQKKLISEALTHNTQDQKLKVVP
jgi:2-oxoglutarate dehydrogenase E1 component